MMRYGRNSVKVFYLLPLITSILDVIKKRKHIHSCIHSEMEFHTFYKKYNPIVLFVTLK